MSEEDRDTNITVMCRGCQQSFVGSKEYNYTKCPFCCQEDKGFYFK